MWLLLLLLLVLALVGVFGGLGVFVAKTFFIALAVVFLVGLLLGGWAWRGGHMH